MAHSIFGNRFFGKREPAWHGLGTVFNDSPTATEAVQRAGADFRVEKRPLLFSTPNGTRTIPGKVALIREPVHDDPDWTFFGTASEDYTILQNRDIAKALDPLTAEWPVETVGVLGQGETLFISLDAGHSSIAGEDMKDYFLVTDTKDGGTTLRILYTPVRVVCQNTLVLGIKQATTTAQLGHRKGLEEEYSFRVNLMAQLRKAQEEVKARLAHLAAMKLAEDQIAEVLAVTYPAPKTPQKVQLLEEAGDVVNGLDTNIVEKLYRAKSSHDYATERVQVWRKGALELYERFNDEYPDVAGTGWALYNAVVESADYRIGNTPDNIAKSALFGQRAAEKTRAYNALVSLV